MNETENDTKVVNFENLIPATIYQFSIRCIPTIKSVNVGFWSDDIKDLTMTTLPAGR